MESSNLDDMAEAAAYISHLAISRDDGKPYKLTGPQLLTLEEIGLSVLNGLGRDVCINTIGDNNLRNILAQSVDSKDQVNFLMEILGIKTAASGTYT